MGKKPKKRWRKWLEYKFDSYVSRGVRAQFVLLLIAIIIIVLIFGVITGLISPDFSISDAIWQSLMHIIDQGTVSGDEPSNVRFVVPMLLVTFLGMALTGTIVGIINNAMSEKLDDLKKGHSQILENGHIVIIGFDDNIYTILKEIEQSNENYKGNRTIVIVDEQEKETMEFVVHEHDRTIQRAQGSGGFFNKKLKSKKVFRSGSTISENTFSVASIETARAIIINKDDDFDVIRIVLAIKSYFEKNTPKMSPTIVTLIHEKENVEAAAIAAGIECGESFKIEDLDNKNSDIRVLYFEDLLAHIFAQVCKQPGLSWILSELFNYDNSEIYIENTFNMKAVPSIEKWSFEEVSQSLKNSIAIGIYKVEKDCIMLNPKPSDSFEKGDCLIHMAVDDNEINIDKEYQRQLVGSPAKPSTDECLLYHFLIFGWTIPLPQIVENIDGYAMKGSTMQVLTKHKDDSTNFTCPYQPIRKRNRKSREIGELSNISFEINEMDPYDWSQVKDYLDHEVDWSDSNPNRPTNIVIMCQDGIDKIEADEKTAVLLLNVRQYLKKKKLENVITITTEMNLPEDQHLLALTNINDFIVGSEIANRMMVQVSNNTNIFRVFKELLTKDGSEIYLKDFSRYVDVTKEFNFEYIQQVALDKGKNKEGMQEVALGWIKIDNEVVVPQVNINPSMEERRKLFSEIIGTDPIEEYRLVVLANNLKK